MKRPMMHPAAQQRGAVLVTVLLLMTILLIQGLAFLAVARTADNVSSNYRDHMQTFYAAEAGLETGLVGLRDLLATPPAPTPAELAALVPPVLSDPDYTFGTFQVAAIRPTPYTTTLDSGAYTGLLAQATDYRITAEVIGPLKSRVRLAQVVHHMEIPLFQFGVFYGRGVDSRSLPGPP